MNEFGGIDRLGVERGKTDADRLKLRGVARRFIEFMRTTTTPPIRKPRGFRIRSEWTAARAIREMNKASAANVSYWSQTRRPLPCLAFILPILAIYELGVVWLGGGSAAAYRTGADAWIRRGLGVLGLTDQWLPPLILIVALLAWQVADPRQWRFSPNYLVGMAIESLLLAVTLVGLSRGLDFAFDRLDRVADGSGRILAAGSAIAAIVSFLGAGVYEEAIFRLAMIPLSIKTLKWLQTPGILAETVAVTGSALLFSLAHHAGSPGEAFTWYAFIFRWMAGVYFAWVFVARGFGVAVGTHVAYDLIVGWIGRRF
jgi:hypothetical protein